MIQLGANGWNVNWICCVAVPETILSRVLCLHLVVGHLSPPPILSNKIEKIVSDGLLEMQQIRQPLTVNESIQLIKLAFFTWFTYGVSP
jgi:hypothetical protein